jgi:hypothetical protein
MSIITIIKYAVLSEIVPVVANEIRILCALALGSRYSSFTYNQNSFISMLPDFVVKVLSEDSSIRFSSCAEVNSDGALAVSGSKIHANFSISCGKYFSKHSLSCVMCSSKTDLSCG